MNNKLLVSLLLFFGIISLLLLIDNGAKEKKIKELTYSIQQSKIDALPESYYYLNAYTSYENQDWNGVTTNVFAYVQKTQKFNLELNPIVYLYNGYAYYKLGFINEKKNNELLLKSNEQLDLYVKINNKNTMAYFIKGLTNLALMMPPKDKSFDKYANDAENAFNYALSTTTIQSQIDKINYHLALVFYHKALDLRSRDIKSNVSDLKQKSVDLLNTLNDQKSKDVLKEINNTLK